MDPIKKFQNLITQRSEPTPDFFNASYVAFVINPFQLPSIIRVLPLIRDALSIGGVTTVRMKADLRRI